MVPGHSTSADTWTTSVPTYISGYTYYRCFGSIFSDDDPNGTRHITYGQPFKDESMSSAVEQLSELIDEKGKIHYTYSTTDIPEQYNRGDLWYVIDPNNNDRNRYIATYIAKQDSTGVLDHNASWIKTSDKIAGILFDVNKSQGTITMEAPYDITVSAGRKLIFTGGSGIDIGSGGDISIGSEGKLIVVSDNFNITQEGNVSVKGRIHATGLVIGEGAVDDFNDAITETDVYKNTISPRLLSDDQREVLQTMYFNSTEGLVVTAHDANGVLSPYSTATKNDGFYIRYNNTDIAKFTGLVAEVNSLVIGDIVVKKTSKGGWLWTDYTRS